MKIKDWLLLLPIMGAFAFSYFQQKQRGWQVQLYLCGR